MKVTRFTDYSLRVLIYLAVNKDELCTIKEIADSYSISKNHLMKVTQELNIIGVVHAIRGKNGGLKLAKSPSEINIGKLIRKIEQGDNLVECFGSDNQCVISPACRLKEALSVALDAFFTKLEEFTLADLLAGQTENQIRIILSPLVDKSATEI